VKLARLKELARLYNVQLNYEDAAGKRRTASRDALVSVLRTRTGQDDLTAALAARQSELASRFVEPVTVVWGRARLRVELRVPEDRAETPLDWELRREDGTVRTGRIDLSTFAREWAADDYVGKTVVIDEVLPTGYHLLRIGDAETFVMAAPMRAHAPPAKSWGIFAPLYAVHTATSWGAGDLGDLRAYREWVSEMGGGVVATLPMLAVDAEGDPSPYSPLSRLFWNELYLDIERVPEFDAADRDDNAIAALQKTDRVDYAGVMREKRRVLERMLTRFRRDAEFDAFAKQARDYARFRSQADDRGSEDYHLYVQYRMAQQMRDVATEAKRSGLGLYLDFPLGVNPNGYDASRFASSFVRGVSVGAPPDLFFTRGQSWGFPPFDPDAIRVERYDYFRRCIAHHASHAGVLRIDHVMGLHRLFWIPEGGEPKDGVYVRYPEDELYAVLTIESNRHRCAIVGEDLGTVPQYVPGMMKKHGLRRMYVVQYEAKPDDDEPVGKPSAESVASINTHDMPTFAGFWSGRDIDDRVQQALLDERGAADERRKREETRDRVRHFLKAQGLLQDERDDTRAVLAALLRFLGASDAEIVLVNLEDLWLETEPQNVPGVPERSWRHKFVNNLEDTRRDLDVIAILSSIGEQRREVDGNAS
jgi:4-alpha-glucanotransferase